MRKFVVGAVVIVLMSQPAWAARTTAHEAAESPAYGRKIGGMLGRGVINVTTCFVDLLVNLVNETRSGPPFIGTLVGLGKGVGCGSLRLLSGAVDLTTFWVPGFNGFPVSDSYEDCLSVAPAQPSVQAAPTLDYPAQASTWQEPMMESQAESPTPPVKVPARTEERPRHYTK